MIITYAKLLACLFAAAGIGFLIGSFTRTKPDSSATKEQQVTQNKDVHKEITSVKSPDGTIKTVTVIDSTTQTSKDTKVANIIKAGTKYQIGGLLGFDQNQNKTYGGFITAEFIGPLRLGVYGLSSNNYGFILSLDF